MALELKDKKNNFYNVKSCGRIEMAIKDVDFKTRTVTGYYNTFNFLDDQQNVLLPGCAKKTIGNSGPESQAVCKIKHALFHDLNQLPGRIDVLREQEMNFKGTNLNGIYFETWMDTSTIGDDTLIKYQEKVYDNHSIGYRDIDSYVVYKDAHGNSKQWDNIIQNLINPEAAKDLDAILVTKEIEMYEGSTVAWGANTMTPFLNVKSGNPEALQVALFSRMNLLTKQLKKGTVSDESMKTFELQLLQIKQIISELFEKSFTNKNAMGYEDHSKCFKCNKAVMPTDDETCPECDDDLNVKCKGCNETSMPKADGSCPKCNQQMKSLIIPDADFLSMAAKGLGI